MGTSNATNNTVAIRNSYKALMAACLSAKGGDAATFNRKVERLMSELADGEHVESTPARYLSAAQEVAYYQYGVNFRNVVGCQ